MTAKRITKKLTKIAAYILGAILVLLTAFHIWFVNHAEDLIEQLVRDQSNGKVNLKVQKFHFNWFSRKMELEKAVFFTTDTLDAPAAYRFEVGRLKIQMKRIWPVITEKRFLIDSIHLLNPYISVTRLRPAKNNPLSTDSSLSIPQEMGRIYHSIQDALKVLEVDRFHIHNGTFALINKMSPEEKPIIISRLDMYLDNLQVDSTQSDGEKKILFSDNVDLRTTNQDILFPDGRHRLSFRDFRINVRNRLAEFDSCTIIATKSDSTTSSFRIFFDKLRMTNIDFDTLYHTEVIKADSVYCINPRFRLDVELPKRTGPMQPPKLDELIQQLTGNLELAFVIVQNASFDINTMREGRPSSFTSDNNNFELQGLHIQQNSARPMVVERFAMAIRNYENFLRDSAYAIRFDSILLNNNRISLSNFSYKELKNNKVVNSLIMPQLELEELSWDNLVFNQQLKAQKVNLYRPVINYNTNTRAQSQNIFEVLSDIGNIFQLSQLSISEGQLNLFLPNSSSLHLQDATMSVSGKKLVDARRLASIQRSVNELNFRKGIFKSKTLTATLDNASFNGTNNGLKAEIMLVNGPDNLSLNARQISIKAMLFDEQFIHSVIKDINWESADINIHSLPGSSGVSSGLSSESLTLENISGKNTNIHVQHGNQKINVFLQTIRADTFETIKGQPLLLKGLSAHGNDLTVKDSTLQLSIKTLDITDKNSSLLENISYESNESGDSILLAIPSISLVPDINAILQGRLHASAVKIFQPFAKINLFADSESVGTNKTGWQQIYLGSLHIQDPVVQFRSTGERGSSSLEWQGKENGNFLEITNLKTTKDPALSVSADHLGFSMNRFQFTNAKGKKFEAGKGQLTAHIKNLALQKNETDNWDWQGVIASLVANNFIVDSLGKKDGILTITSARLQDLAISSGYLLNMRDLVSHNTGFNLDHVTGAYRNNAAQFKWFNAGYDQKTKYFSVDSFSYYPVPGRDEYIKSQPYQTDYMTGKTGRIDIGPFDIQRYSKDTILELGTVNIDSGYLTSFRDKRVPREPGAIRPLPVTILKKIPLPLSADTVFVKNTLVEYSEAHEKTGAEGKITVGNLNGRILHMRNFNLAPSDSLEIHASGYLENTLLTKLSVKESYTDSSKGFLMTGEMGAADLTVLNPVLIPLASAELKSGKLDTMSMQVVGTDSLAFGEIKMYYHDLKVRVNKPGKKSFLPGITTFLINTLIKNENRNRTGTIFFIRLKNRSPINYLVKLTLSGMTSSIGIQRNKKDIRRYKREIKKEKLRNPSFHHLPAG